MLGAGIRTSDRTLCANVSFWRKLSCGEDYVRCQAGNSGQCVHWELWGAEGYWGSCVDGSDLYRPIKQATETEDPGSQASQADSNNHGSDDGEQRINNGGDDNVAEEEEKPLKMRTADKRDSTEAKGGRQSQPQVWKTKPENEEQEEGAKYVKDSRTGLWMIPESDPFKVPPITEEDFEKGPYSPERKKEIADFYSRDDYVKDATTNRMAAAPTEETCMASQGFVCKVRLSYFT